MNNKPTIIPNEFAGRFVAALLIFLVILPIWILAVAPSDANPKTTTNKVLPLLSVYSNTNGRPDPFLPVKLKGGTGTAEPRAMADDRELHLQGILWHPTQPMAVINRQRIGLNQTVPIQLTSGVFQVKAISIERDRVTLQIDGRQAELRLER